MSRTPAERAFRLALSLKADRHLGPGRRTQAAYETFFRKCCQSRLMRFLFGRITPRFHCSFEEYVLYVASLLFEKRGIPQFYLPIVWNGTALSAEMHLAQPSFFVARHNGFGFLAKSITDLGKLAATPVAKPENPASVAKRLARSGVSSQGLVKTFPADRTILLQLRKELERGGNVACFIDRVSPQTGRADIVETGIFDLARITRKPLYFVRYSVNEQGRVTARMKGPVDCSDVPAALAAFMEFYRD